MFNKALLAAFLIIAPQTYCATSFQAKQNQAFSRVTQLETVAALNIRIQSLHQEKSRLGAGAGLSREAAARHTTLDRELSALEAQLATLTHQAPIPALTEDDSRSAEAVADALFEEYYGIPASAAGQSSAGIAATEGVLTTPLTGPALVLPPEEPGSTTTGSKRSRAAMESHGRAHPYPDAESGVFACAAIMIEPTHVAGPYLPRALPQTATKHPRISESAAAASSSSAASSTAYTSALWNEDSRWAPMPLAIIPLPQLDPLFPDVNHFFTSDDFITAWVTALTQEVESATYILPEAPGAYPTAHEYERDIRLKLKNHFHDFSVLYINSLLSHFNSHTYAETAVAVWDHFRTILLDEFNRTVQDKPYVNPPALVATRDWIRRMKYLHVLWVLKEGSAYPSITAKPKPPSSAPERIILGFTELSTYFMFECEFNRKALSRCVSCQGKARYRCSICKRAQYCSYGCQEKQWPQHSALCHPSRLEDFLPRPAEASTASGSGVGTGSGASAR